MTLQVGVKNPSDLNKVAESVEANRLTKRKYEPLEAAERRVQQIQLTTNAKQQELDAHQKTIDARQIVNDQNQAEVNCLAERLHHLKIAEQASLKEEKAARKAQEPIRKALEISRKADEAGRKVEELSALELKKVEAVDKKILQTNRALLTNFLYSMVYPLFAPSQVVLKNVSPEEEKHLIDAAIAKCIHFIEPLFANFESKSPEDFLAAIDVKKTMEFIQVVTPQALMSLENASCKSPDSSKFGNELDSAREIFLNAIRMEKVEFDSSAKGAQTEQKTKNLINLA